MTPTTSPSRHYLHRLLLTLLGSLLLMACSCASARAEGGSSIASAPPVTYGQQEFGNLSVAIFKGDYCEVVPYRSWWTLPVTAGDSLHIDWEAQDNSTDIHLFASGSTDFNFTSTQPVASAVLQNNLKDELAYQATQTGTMPLEFLAYGWCPQTPPGPYSFTAYVTHAVRLGLPRLSRLHGSVQVGVHTPAGTPITDPELTITIQSLYHGHWHSLGTASPSNGLATLALFIPASLRGHHLTLRATAHGPDYQPTSSATERVRVG